MERALHEASEITSAVAREKAYHGALASLTEEDPERCLRLAGQHLGDTARREVSEKALASWLQTDPSAAWDAIEETPSAADRLRFTREAGRQWALLDPEGVGVWIDSIADEVTRRSALTGVAISFSKTDIDRAIEVFEKLNWDVTDHQPEWLEGPRSKSGMGDSSEETLGKAAHHVALSLIGRSFEEALAFADRFKGERDEFNTRYEIVRQWLQKDPQGMSDHIQRSPDSRIRGFLAHSYAAKMSDPGQAVAWAKALDGEAREAAMRSAFHKAFEGDASEAIELLPELEGLPASVRMGALEMLWSGRRKTLPQLQAVHEWLVAQPDYNTDLAEGFRNLVNGMAYADLDHAVEVLEQLDQGAPREAAIGGLLGFLGNASLMDFDACLHWIGQSQSERTRQFWLKIVAEKWLAKDPDRAVKAMPQTGISKEVWEQLVSRHERNQRP